MNDGTKPQYIVEELTDDELERMLEREPVFDWKPLISIDPNVAFGKPVVTGTRLAVEFILDLFAGGWTEEQVLDSYPSLTRDSLRAVFAYAADLAHERQQRPAWMREPRRSRGDASIPR